MPTLEFLADIAILKERNKELENQLNALVKSGEDYVSRVPDFEAKNKELEQKLAEMTKRKDQLIGAYELCEKLYRNEVIQLAIAKEALEDISCNVHSLDTIDEIVDHALEKLSE